jgi:hypothetical protein
MATQKVGPATRRLITVLSSRGKLDADSKRRADAHRYAVSQKAPRKKVISGIRKKFGITESTAVTWYQVSKRVASTPALKRKLNGRKTPAAGRAKTPGQRSKTAH